MLRVFSTYFWFSTLLFAANQLLEKSGIVIPYVHSYLDDILCPGIVLGFTLAVQQQLTFKNTTYRIGKGQLLFFLIWYSFLFEILFPLFDARHHSDILDVVAYAFGTLLYHKMGNRPAAFLLFAARDLKT